MSLTRDASGLFLGGMRLSDALAVAGTPSYVYDLDGMSRQARALDAAFDGAPHLVAYAVKANTAGPVVRTLAEAGCGADVVSGAELLVALACGIAPDRIVYSGVAKQDEELDRAIGCGPRGIGSVQLESVEEIARVEARARAAGRRARVSIRVNPSVDVGAATHAHIATGHDEAKFGVPRDDVGDAVRRVGGSAHLELVGMATHVGSQFTTREPYLEAARVLFAMVRGLRDSGALPSLAFVDSGGGFGIDYAGGPAPEPGDFVRAVRVEQKAAQLADLALYVEPGRSLVARFGVLLARVIQTKVARARTPERSEGADAHAAKAGRWLMIDAGMNDLMRPALYQARHRIVPLEGDEAAATRDLVGWRVVGPVCESSDDFGEHPLPREAPRAVAILDAGAYGYTMASQYNGRQLPVEVFVRGGRIVGKTARASVEAWANERANVGR